MRRNYGLVLLIVGGLCLTGCTRSEVQAVAVSDEPISGVAIAAKVDGDTVTVPRALIEEHGNTHFTFLEDGESLSFMAYDLGGAIHVRANACPPCRSRGFTLVGDVLDCDACHTTFDAGDGSGIQGACVDYPKAAVHYTEVGGSIVMAWGALVAAWEATLIAG